MFLSRSYKKLLLSFILPVLIFQGVLFTTPQKAYAGLASGSVVVVSTNIVDDLKEWALDGALGWAIVNTMIAAMGDSVVQWINSGFQGDPLFVSNPKAFYGDVLNEVSGQFITDIDAGFICEPFKPQITIALAQQDSFLQRSQCTFLDGAANVEAFINDFNAGGWQGWISLTQQQQNNPYGAYFMAADERNRRLVEAEQNAREEVGQNEGFLSVKRCVLRDSTAPAQGEVEAGTGNVDPYPQIEAGTGNIAEPEGSCLRWETQTPGQAIVGSLDESLGAPLDRLGQADEITEAVLSAIMDALLNQMVIGGLRSLSDSDASPGENVYVAATTQERDRLLNEIDKTIEENERILGSESKVETIKELYGGINECYEEQKTTIRDPNFYPTPNIDVPPIHVIEDKQEEVAEASKELDQETRTGPAAAEAGENIGKMIELREDIIETEERKGRLTPQDIRDFNVRYDKLRREVDLQKRGQDLNDLEKADDEIEAAEKELGQCEAQLEVLQGQIREAPVPTPVNCVEGCDFEASGNSSGEGGE